MKKLKALFHVDEMGKWKLTLKNINNFLNGAEDPDILVVANAVAVKGNNVNLEDIGEFVKIVPAGVIEIAKKQMEGYAYIRP